MVPVLHQEGGSVGLELGEEFHHVLGMAELAHEHFQVGIIDGIGVFRDAGIDELGQLVFQAEAVDIHLHIIGDLVGADAHAQVPAGILLLLFFFRIKAEADAALFQETQGGGLQVRAGFRSAVEYRLTWTEVNAESRQVFLPHGFNRGIIHTIMPPSIYNGQLL